MTHFLQLLLLLTLVIAAAKLAGALANRLHQPAVFGEIFIGLVLGPTVLDVLGWPFFRRRCSPRSKTSRSSASSCSCSWRA